MFDFTTKEMIFLLFSGIGGVVLSAFIVRTVYKKVNSNKVKQSKNKVGGDLAGRDIKK